MFNTFQQICLDLPLIINLHNLYLHIYIFNLIFIFLFFVCLVCWQYFKEIHSIVIQFAFGNPTGGTVNWFYFT